MAKGSVIPYRGKRGTVWRIKYLDAGRQAGDGNGRRRARRHRRKQAEAELLERTAGSRCATD